MKQQIVRDSTTDYLELEVWDHNVQVVPTSALISIMVDWGDVPDSMMSATITSTGICIYYPTSTAISELEENAIAEWKLTIAGVPRHFRQMFDIVLYPMYPAVTDEDLIAECAQLQDARYMEAGLADSGNSVSLTSILIKEYQDNHFQGGTLEITDGTCKGEKQRIAGNVRSTGTITIDASLSTSVDSTSRFLAKRSYQREIDRAWEDLEAVIQGKGYRPALIVNSEDIRPVHLALTLTKVCRNLSKGEEDLWWSRMKVYENEYTSKLGQMKFLYDMDEDEWPDTYKAMIHSFRR